MKLRNQAITIVDAFDPESAAVTEFRRLLYRLNGRLGPKNKRDQGGLEPEIRRVLITSAVVAEGKSTIASFLAISSAKIKEKRTLLVDCDLRRPNIHRLFSLERQQGLSEALMEGMSSEKLIKHTELEKLDIITAGKHVEHPAEVFDAVAIGRILDELSHRYDLIVLDSAPILPVSDPMLLAGIVDGSIIVIMAGKTQRQIVARAKGLLTAAGTRILGVVMNNPDKALPAHYDPSYYSYETIDN